MWPEPQDWENYSPGMDRAGVNNRLVIPKNLDVMHEHMVKTKGGIIRDDPQYAVTLLVDAAALRNIEEIMEHTATAGDILKAEWNKTSRNKNSSLLNGSHRQWIIRQNNQMLLEARDAVAKSMAELEKLEK